MRFHTTSRIYRSDRARAWQFLLKELGDATIDVTRLGNLVRLTGLGPGDVSMNKEDVAVLTAEEEESSVLLEVDGTFDGSYLQVSEQEKVVREKLYRIFEQVQLQVYWAEGMQLKGLPRKEPETTKFVPPIAVTSARPQHERETALKEEFGPEGSSGLEHLPEIVLKEQAVDQQVLAAAMPDRMTGAENSVVEAGGSETAPGKAYLPKQVETRRVPVFALHQQAAVSPWQIGFLLASLAAATLVVGGVDAVVRYMHPLGESKAGEVAQLPSNPQPRAESNVEPVRPPPPAPAAYESPLAMPGETNPVALIQHWESAMRTRNAAAQSAFYADTVDRYLEQSHVSKPVVQQQKEAAIAARDGLWTMKVENMVIGKRTPDEVRVQLVKHVIDQPAPSQIKEDFVRTELVLRRTGATWKIASEREMGELHWKSRS